MTVVEPGTAGPDLSAVVDGVDVEAVAAAARGCSAVDDLCSTPAAVVASYLPRRQVAGVRVGPDSVVLQVRGRWGVPVQDLAGQVRRAVAELVAHRRVDIVVADITAEPATGDPKGDHEADRATRPDLSPDPSAVGAESG